ncbi:TetR family transcriptional regulator [Actinomadura sp. CNU-125]|uniref:TetR family transcriptional regulator n=1 Tax=Actinomadura sp. CNU-125 TaxID=1904961 RepID=UPI0021CC575B|nr:TetR family transcriptional regulator [Actinomadura sp. CNU-125]
MCKICSSRQLWQGVRDDLVPGPQPPCRRPAQQGGHPGRGRPGPDARPDAGVAAVATAAGVTRQTVYAHFPTRDRLLSGVLDHLTAATVAEMDAADLDTGPAAEALLRLLDAGADGRPAPRPHAGARRAARRLRGGRAAPHRDRRPAPPHRPARQADRGIRRPAPRRLARHGDHHARPHRERGAGRRAAVGRRGGRGAPHHAAAPARRGRLVGSSP